MLQCCIKHLFPNFFPGYRVKITLNQKCNCPVSLYFAVALWLATQHDAVHGMSYQRQLRLQGTGELVISCPQPTPLALINLITFDNIQIARHRGDGWVTLLKSNTQEHSINCFRTLQMISQALFVHLVLFRFLGTGVWSQRICFSFYKPCLSNCFLFYLLL